MGGKETRKTRVRGRDVNKNRAIWGLGGGLANHGHVHGLMSMVCPRVGCHSMDMDAMDELFLLLCSPCGTLFFWEDCVLPVVPCFSGKIVCFLLFPVFLTAPCQKKKRSDNCPPHPPTIMCAQEGWGTLHAGLDSWTCRPMDPPMDGAGGLWALGLSSRSEEGLMGPRSASHWGSQAQAHLTHPRTMRCESGVYTS